MRRNRSTADTLAKDTHTQAGGGRNPEPQISKLSPLYEMQHLSTGIISHIFATRPQVQRSSVPPLNMNTSCTAKTCNSGKSMEMGAIECDKPQTFRKSRNADNFHFFSCLNATPSVWTARPVRVSCIFLSLSSQTFSVCRNLL